MLFFFLLHHGQTCGNMTVSSEDDEDDGGGGLSDCVRNSSGFIVGGLVPSGSQDGNVEGWR
jgi:hypothetical protein